MNFEDINYLDLQVGDIVFVSSNDFTGFANKLGQYIFNPVKHYENFIPTHSAIVVDDNGYIIHSEREYGVNYSFLHRYIDNPNYNDTVIIFRNKIISKLKKDPKFFQYEELFTAIFNNHWGNFYNNRFYLKLPTEGKEFCSEFVVNFYKDLQLSFQSFDAHKVFPNDLLGYCKNSTDWEFVQTEFLNSFKLSYLIAPLKNELDKMASDRSERAEIFRKQFNEGIEQTTKAYEGLQEISKIGAKQLNSFQEFEEFQNQRNVDLINLNNRLTELLNIYKNDGK